MAETRKEQTAPAPVVTYSQPEALPGVMLVTAAFRGTMAPSTIYRRWTFARTDAGDGDVMIGKTELRLGSGVLLALEPGDCIVPLRRRSESTAFRTLLIEPEFVTRFIATA